MVGLPLMAVVLLWQIARFAGELLNPRLVRHNPFRAIGDRLTWRVPVIGSITRHAAISDFYYAVADALDAGHSLDIALSSASVANTNIVLAKRVRRWTAAIRGGMSLSEAATAAGMPELDAGLLATPSAGGDLQRVLRFLARYHHGRFSRSALLLRSALIPAMALIFGILVASFALSLFLPLRQLMNHMGPIHCGPL